MKQILLLIAAMVSTQAIAETETTNYAIELGVGSGEYDASKFKVKKGSFDCGDQILARVKVTGAEQGILEPTVEWVGPDGKTQEKVTLMAGVNRDGTGEFLSFIQFRKGQGASLFSFIEPSMSLESFIGSWEIKILLNGHTVSKSDFEVIC